MLMNYRRLGFIALIFGFFEIILFILRSFNKLQYMGSIILGLVLVVSGLLFLFKERLYEKAILKMFAFIIGNMIGQAFFSFIQKPIDLWFVLLKLNASNNLLSIINSLLAAILFFLLFYFFNKINIYESTNRKDNWAFTGIAVFGFIIIFVAWAGGYLSTHDSKSKEAISKIEFLYGKDYNYYLKYYKVKNNQTTATITVYNNNYLKDIEINVK